MQHLFSAGVAQMDELQNGYDGGSVVDGTRVDLLNNQVCLVTYKNSGTAVTGFADISKAKIWRLLTELFL